MQRQHFPACRCDAAELFRQLLFQSGIAGDAQQSRTGTAETEGCTGGANETFDLIVVCDHALAVGLVDAILHGVTLSGGEPLNQAMACYDIAQAAKQMGLNVWCYTGYTMEYLRDNGAEEQKALLAEVDVLVDGRYIQEKRSLSLDWRGSSNQRVIDLKEVQGDG